MKIYTYCLFLLLMPALSKADAFFSMSSFGAAESCTIIVRESMEGEYYWRIAMGDYYVENEHSTNTENEFSVTVTPGYPCIYRDSFFIHENGNRDNLFQDYSYIYEKTTYEIVDYWYNYPNPSEDDPDPDSPGSSVSGEPVVDNTKYPYSMPGLSVGSVSEYPMLLRSGDDSRPYVLIDGCFGEGIDISKIKGFQILLSDAQGRKAGSTQWIANDLERYHSYTDGETGHAGFAPDQEGIVYTRYGDSFDFSLKFYPNWGASSEERILRVYISYNGLRYICFAERVICNDVP